MGTAQLRPAARAVLVFVALTLLSACTQVGGLAMSSLENVSGPERLGDEETLIVGRLELIEDGAVVQDYETFTSNVLVGFVRIGDLEETYGRFTLDETGWFRWVVPTGTYVIPRVKYNQFCTSSLISPQAGFSVPKPGMAYYLGTLRIAFSQDCDLLGGELVVQNVEVIDQGDEDFEAMVAGTWAEQLPRMTSLMVHDERLPRRMYSEAQTEGGISALGWLGLSGVILTQ